MCNLRGLTLAKSTATHKVAGKNLSIKRKLGVFKKDSMKHRDSNSSEVKFNEHCSANGLENCKFKLEEVDIFNKIEPNVGHFQVFADCSVDFEQ